MREKRARFQGPLVPIRAFCYGKERVDFHTERLYQDMQKVLVIMSTPSPTTSLSRDDLAARLAQLQSLEAIGDQHAERLMLLSDKLRQDRTVLAFCGHFSAGKSSLINRLAGGPVLPASPIPTSANRVLLRHGAPGATVWFRSRGEVGLDASDLHRLAAFCADGDEVDAVEVRYPLAHVPEGLWLMDTPGIDSTDGAHRIATESALYLADAVFYVMDYNHVQSEVNFQFTRSLAEWGKPLYLVVNQVDKHVELELPFAQFRRSVTDAFASWGVFPQAILFTSLREEEHPLNQWASLVQEIASLGQKRDELLQRGVWRSAARVMAEEERLRDEAATAGRNRLEELARAGAGGAARTAAIATELERLAGLPGALTSELRREVETLLANAPLFPFATRDLARLYLESRRPNFRVGFLFSGNKTEQEVARRLAALHADLSETATAHIQWHLTQLLRDFAERHGLDDEDYRKDVEGLSVALEPAWLAGLVNAGAVASDQYLTRYPQEVAMEIQGLYRAAAAPLIDRIAVLVRERAEREAATLRAEQAVLADAVSAAARIAAMEEASAQFRAEWQAILGGAQDEPNRPEQTAAEAEVAAAAPRTLGLNAAGEGGAPAPAAAEGTGRRADAARRVRAASALLAPLPGMARTAADLQQRAVRLEESRFTVALFGAFSAGKSSFANALMGAHLLPVSPNPTTAVINRIMPPEAGRPHGHVQVTWKRPEALQQEVVGSLSAVGLQATGDIAADLRAGAERSRQETLPSAKPHAAFLAAAARGYAAAAERLGRAEAAGLDRFAALVADEAQSCFVADIAVHVDCPLTSHSITLVDTPGADSINARHTGVAFDYIKNADAILFVTYYNHAFSHADREFLTQLGRVKDAFALDKMFFVINAADLAQSEAELEEVVAHVRTNLQACGIRQARIFPVSSQTALWSRLRDRAELPDELAARLQRRTGGAPGLEASGMAAFESAFYRFTVTELSNLAVGAAFAEVERATQTVASWMEAARADEGARSARLESLRLAEAEAVAGITALSLRSEVQSLEQEIDELLYYARRRVLERYRTGFAEAFNPAVLRNDTPDLKRALHGALREVLEFVAFDLSQEMRATALRVENAVNRLAQRAFQRAGETVAQRLEQWTCPPYTEVHPSVPDFPSGRDQMNPEPHRTLLSLFRNPEQFFAGGGRAALRDELGKSLEAPVTEYLSSARQQLLTSYGTMLALQGESLKAALIGAVGDHLGGLTAALTTAGEADRLDSTCRQLRTLVTAAK